MAKKIVVIPTYNERGNITAIVPRILAVDPEIEVLVVDDSSPDGTADAVTQMAHAEPRVHLLLRTVRQGIGPAYIAGFRRALEMGAELVVQMDADFSHPVASLPDLFREIDGADVILGSRYIHGITVVNWPIERLLLSYFGNAYARRVTGMPVRDITGGFKCWKRSALESVDLDRVRSNGYAFQIEMTYRLWRKGGRIKELPIIFADRTIGESKMSKRISIEAFWIVWWLKLQDRRGKL
ncbi:MAG: dolichyl-phosphate beta-D-mannosyltransferase [Polyangiaceae bacterium UTPRO1]|jgi:dolichol-phosphate mannosyltransferase|nr:polyprenol monophosphomannose synthase [Myxococcales bacterium]OQY68613.1 MAG: dolichyl-phosphate beta-D-mannosyltransferase [Polyangiaceae bacterium UTPRO1]